MNCEHIYRNRRRFDKVRALGEEYARQEHPSPALVAQIDDAIEELKLFEHLQCPICGREADVLIQINDPYETLMNPDKIFPPDPEWACPVCLRDSYDPNAPGLISKSGIWNIIRATWRDLHPTPQPTGPELIGSPDSSPEPRSGPCTNSSGPRIQEGC